MRHRRLRIEHPLVDIDVDNVCSIRDLLARNRDCALEIAGQNQFRKLRRTGDIRALTDDSESKVAREVEWLEAGKSKRTCGLRIAYRRLMLRTRTRVLWQRQRWKLTRLFRKCRDVRRRCSATAPDHV